jgi:hypothetical protein
MNWSAYNEARLDLARPSTSVMVKSKRDKSADNVAGGIESCLWLLVLYSWRKQASWKVDKQLEQLNSKKR